MNTPYKHREVLGDNTFVYDTDQVYCVWQNTWSPEEGAVDIDLDFFIPDEKGCYYPGDGEFPGVQLFSGNSSPPAGRESVPAAGGPGGLYRFCSGPGGRTAGICGPSGVRGKIRGSGAKALSAGRFLCCPQQLSFQIFALCVSKK